MTVSLSNLLTKIDALYHSKVTIAEVAAASIGFPFPMAYEGQMRAYHEMRKLGHAKMLLSAHTGSGKSAVFITVARNSHEPTIIIETRKFLQKQVASYFPGIPVVFGKSEYRCKFAQTAAEGPCWFTMDKPSPDQWAGQGRCRGCEHEGSGPCSCKHFMVVGEFPIKMCRPDECAYRMVMANARSELKRGGIIICNHANFWAFLNSAQRVIIDEADAFIKAISTGTYLEYQHVAKWDESTPIRTLLTEEAAGINKEMGKVDIRTLDGKFRFNRLSYRLERVNFLITHEDLCFAYVKSKRKNPSVWIELRPGCGEVIIDKIFHDKAVTIVTATPGDFPGISNVVNYSVPQRTRIFYTPVGHMTVKSIMGGRQYLLSDAARYIDEMSHLFDALYGAKKAVIHCGNLREDYAGVVVKTLGPENCVVHERGQLMQTLERFTTGPERYLLAVSAEHGADFRDIPFQFILKVPFASQDERMRALKRSMDAEEKGKFSHWYAMDAMNRLVQQCGRVGRGAGAFGVTLILDSKFNEMYGFYKNRLPAWFNERLVMEV